MDEWGEGPTSQVLNRDQSSGCDREIPAASTKPPYYGILPSNARIDANVKQFLDGALKSHGLFTGWSKLKHLDQELEAAAREILEKEGEEAFRKAGGRRDNVTGKLTLSPNCPRAGQLMIDLGINHKCFLRSVARDSRRAALPREEACWLLPLADGQYLGFSLSWHGQAGPLFDEWKQELQKDLRRVRALPRDLFEDENRLRERWIDQTTACLNLWTRGAQMLSLLHAAAWQQASNLVCLPDVAIGQAIWGGCVFAWPANWRQEVTDVLDHLRLLEFRNWSVTPNGLLKPGSVWQAVAGYDPPNWKPPGPVSIESALATGRACRSRFVPDTCPLSCPLEGQPIRHGHYLIGLAPTFLGVLSAFCHKVRGGGQPTPFAKGEGVEEVLYGWNQRLDKETRAELRGRRSYLVLDTMPGVLLNAQWAELTLNQKRLIHSLLSEVTLARRATRRTALQPNHPETFTSTRPLPISKNVSDLCPLLKEGEEYVCFGGNGKRPGGGYTVGGTPTGGHHGVGSGRRGGWLAKAQYVEVRRGPGGSRQAVHCFLRDLECVMSLIGGVVVGRHGGRWLSMDELKCLTWKEVMRVTIRPFAPVDYRSRLEQHAKDWGGFSEIPRTVEQLSKAVQQEAAESGGILPLDLRHELQMRGISNNVFAKSLGVSAPYLSMVFTGKKRLSKERQQKAVSLLAATMN
jgi:hypothetical protein